MPRAVGMQILRHVRQIKAMRGGQRENQIVFRRGGLQLKIEFSAESLAQGETPSSINVAAKWRMDHELHSTAFVKEALEDNGVLRGQASQSGASGGEIVMQLQRGGFAQSQIIHQPL